MTSRTYRQSKKLKEGSNTSEIVKDVNELVDSHNFLSHNMSFSVNFNGQILENIRWEAGQTLVIPHKLGVLPKFRVILRQEGNGVLSDIPSGWNKYQITLKNEGAVPVTATIMIARE